MKNRFLPIGTVVRLKGGKTEIMITSYCIIPNGSEIVNGEKKKPKRKIYEYGACIFPTGIMDTNTSLGFNHDQIEEIVHMGLENNTYKEFNKVLNANYDNVKKQFEDGTLSADEILNNQ